MSSPGSALPVGLRPVAPALTVVPRPVSSWRRFVLAVEALPPAAVASAGIVAIVTVAFIAGRILAVNLTFLHFIDTTETARMMGSVSFLSIVAIAAAILTGHRGLRALRASERVGRYATTAVLGVAYLHLVLWTTRVLTASIATASTTSALFMPNLFWWG
ncbi:MAG: hypothetical protein KF727_03940 [Microbacteriaceae bacterium]|nr:hypothetical protein [Microbacteriaceae bacterium]